MENILQKVRGLVPFVRDWSKVEWGGDHVPIEESYIKTHRWQNGWREEGQLLLDVNGIPVGVVCHDESNGQGEQWEGKPDVYPGGEAVYLLSYDVKNDTEEEEWASLYRIKEEKRMDTKSKKVIVYWVMGSDGVAGKYYDSSKHKWVFIDNPPSSHWEAYEEMRKSNALVCPQCGQVFYQHIGENWDAVEYEFNNHLDFCEEE
jgi:hypothetical protein